MNNLILLDELSVNYATKYTKTDEEIPLKDVRLLSSTQKKLKSNCVYLTNVPDQFDMLNADHLILILVMKEINPAIRENKTKWIIRTDDSLADVLCQIADIMEEYRSWELECCHALTERIALEDFMNILSRKMQNPIALFDTSLTLIGSAGAFLNDTKGTVWEKVIDLHYTPLELFNKMEQAELSKELAANTRCYTIAAAFDKQHLHYCFPVRLNSKLLGILAMIDLNTKVTPGQKSIGLIITDFICQYFKTETEHLTLSQNTNYFVERLLQGLDVDDRVLEHYLSQRGWHTEGEYLLSNFPVSLINDPLAAQSQLIRIERHFPNALAFLHEGSVVTLISIPTNISCEQICRNIKQFTYDTSLLCGTSDRFYRFSHIKYAYIQSKIALEYADETNRFLSFPVDYADYTVSALGNSISLKAMCHPAILKLAESDNDFDSILVNNLKTYLMYGCSIQDTANALFIHRNTLLYRLDKINHALGTDVRSLSEDDRFYLLMSCIICEERKNKTASK